MAKTVTNLNLTFAWDATNRITVASDAQVVVTNSRKNAYWTITNNTSAPTIDVAKGNHIKAYDTVTIALGAGEYLWIAGSSDWVTVTY